MASRLRKPERPQQRPERASGRTQPARGGYAQRPRPDTRPQPAQRGGRTQPQRPVPRDFDPRANLYGGRRAPASGGGASRTSAATGRRAPSSGARGPSAGGGARPQFGFDIADAFQLGKYLLIGVAALAVVIFIARAVYLSTPTTYEVAGQEVQLARSTTYRDLVDSGELGVSKGDLVAVDGSVLEEGGGADPTVYLDGNPVELDAQASDEGDITAEDGADETEPYTATQEITPIETKVARDKEAEEEGAAQNVFNFYNGVLHVVTDQGQEGITETRTGETSGKTATVQVQDMHPRVFENLHPVLPDSQKLVALTFDDGPSEEGGATEDVLAVLQQYGAKATFFMLGSQAEEYPQVAKKVADAGHQVASHSYSHDAADFLNNVSADEAREQVQKASDAIEAAVGYAPKDIRPPGGNVDLDAILAIDTLADGYIGWTVDPFDYELPGADAIAQNIVSQVTPGAIVLLHDGGGDRSQTVEALKTVIPQLQQQGYTFVTIDELEQAVIASRYSSSGSGGQDADAGGGADDSADVTSSDDGSAAGEGDASN